MKIRNPLYLLALILFLVYIFIFAPSDTSNSFTLIQRMYSPEFRSVNPLIFSVFNLLGVWPMAFTVLVLEESKLQDFPVWPFILLSFFTGGFVYLIYFSLRKSVDERLSSTSLQKRIEKPRNMYLLILVTILLLLYGFVFGDLGGYIQSFTKNSLVHVMTIDFLLLSLLFPVLMVDDMIREKIFNLRQFLVFSVSSVLGATLYLLHRLHKRQKIE